MGRTNGNGYQRETVAIVIAAIVFFVLLVFRNGGNYYISYLHQDASRAEFEIDQSYVLLISEAERVSHPPIEHKERYNVSIVREFREKWVIKPTLILPGKNEMENRTGSVFNSQNVENKIIRELLHDKRDGFFVHCCYFDSKSLSKASELQITSEWESLVMEADLKRYEELKSHTRSYSLVNAELSDNVNTSVDTLNDQILLENLNKTISERRSVTDSIKNFTGFPLEFVMRSFGRTNVDWLVLNAKGKEFGILKALFFDDCKVNVIKTRLDNHGQEIEMLLFEKGYKKWVDNDDIDGDEATFYNVESSQEKPLDVMPLLERLRQAKLTKREV